jgi:iron complex outermembrane receptor protein
MRQPRTWMRQARQCWRSVKSGVGILVAASLLVAGPAGAQRADENAVTAASDAFGTVVGNQTIGLYSPSNARGFSPTQAENLRIEGFYFDQQTSPPINPYLFKGSDMRIGIAAQSYAFPSPSGIADLKLRVPGNSAAASLLLIRGPLTQWSAEIDTQYPLVSDVLSVGLTVAEAHDFDYTLALASVQRAISALARLHPSADTEVVPFFGYIHNTERYETPLVFSNGNDPLPLFDEPHLPTQAWTSWGWDQATAGVIARSVLTGPWSVRIGLFRSVEQHAENFSDLLLGLGPTGIGQRLVDISPAQTASSYSGDLRVTRSTVQSTRQSELTFVLRGRWVKRNYGGDFLADLGPTSIYQDTRFPDPVPVFSAQSRDTVRQPGVGISYSERWKDRGSLTVGVLRTDYNRQLNAPGVPASSNKTDTTLPTVSGTVDVAKAATLYASYTRGLEDSLIAPAAAVNRGEPPPATPTWQVDGGVRANLREHLKLLVGGFEIHKTYFNLDTLDRYTQIGDINARGIESSATWTGPCGLTVVAGAVWLRPEVHQRVAVLGGTGRVPIGPVPRTINVNVDYAPHGNSGVGLSAQWKSLSSRVETSDDRYSLPPLATLNVGVRYMFKIFHRPSSVRLDIGNVTNAAGVMLSSDYLATSQLRRNYTATVASDL